MEIAKYFSSSSAGKWCSSVHVTAGNSKVSLTFQHYGASFTQGLTVLMQFLHCTRY